MQFNSIPDSLKNKYLKKARMVVVSDHNDSYEQNEADKRYLATAIQNMRSIGFIPDNSLFSAMSHLNRDEIVSLYEDIMPTIKEMVGADHEMNDNVIYKNFPIEVMEKDDFTLYSNAIFYYCLTIGVDVPHDLAVDVVDREKEKERFPFSEEMEMKVLSLGTKEDLLSQIKGIAESKITISSDDKAMLEDFMKYGSDFIGKNEYRTFISGLEFQNKENQCLVCSKEIENAKNPIAAFYSIKDNIKTSTDILRLITYISSGSTSLSNNVKFKLNNKQQQVVLGLLENCATNSDIAPDMFTSKYYEKWKRISPIIHPQRNRSRYPKTAQIFDDIYNGRAPLTWASQIETATMDKDFDKMSQLLASRPGELIRRLEKFYDVAKEAERNGQKGATDKAIEQIINASGKCAIPVVLQEYNNVSIPLKGIHLHSKNKDGLPCVHVGELKQRDFMDMCRIREALKEGLVNQLSKKEYMGNIYLDRCAENIVVPSHSMESSNPTATNFETGSRIPVHEDKNEIRFSVWWNNGNSGKRTDVDLHAIVMDSDYERVGSISFYDLKNASIKGYHSGDVTDGGPVTGKGVAEHIVIREIDKERLIKNGARYIVPAPDIYNHGEVGPFGSFPSSFTVQERESQPNEAKINEGNIFEASAVTYQESINLGCYAYIPIMYDVRDNEWIITKLPNFSSVGRFDIDSSKAMKAAIEADYLTIRRYLSFMEEAGIAKIVDSPENADMILGLNRPEEIKENQEFMLLSNPTELTSQWLDDKFRPENILKKTFETKEYAYQILEGYKEILEKDAGFIEKHEQMQAQQKQEEAWANDQFAFETVPNTQRNQTKIINARR